MLILRASSAHELAYKNQKKTESTNEIPQCEGSKFTPWVSSLTTDSHSSEYLRFNLKNYYRIYKITLEFLFIPESYRLEMQANHEEWLPVQDWTPLPEASDSQLWISKNQMQLTWHKPLLTDQIRISFKNPLAAHRFGVKDIQIFSRSIGALIYDSSGHCLVKGPTIQVVVLIRKSPM